jgi:magnesium chelatase subunit D
MHHINRQILPFTAIVGQEKMKKALILNAINTRIGGVLIRGEKGTAKSTAVRSLAELLPEIKIVNGCPFNCNPNDGNEMCDICYERSENGEKLESETKRTCVIDLPLGCTEDRVVGTLNIEKAIKEGIRALEPGILAAANRGILYIDEINLLDDHVADVLLDSAAMGANIVEREGVSVAHPARFILVGTMNPEEGELRPQLLDRFGLQANVESLSDLDARVEIVKVAESFEIDPAGCREEFEGKQMELGEKIMSAKSLLPEVTISDDLLRTTAEMCIELGVRTHRAEIVVTRTAKTIAAFDDRTEVTLDDIKEAMELALPHRMRKKPFEPPELDTEKLDRMMDEKERERNEQEQQQKESEEEEEPHEKRERPEHEHEHRERSEPQNPPDEDEDNDGKQSQQPESVFAIGDSIDVSRVRPKERHDRIHRSKTSGRRIPTLARFNRGRYASHTMPPGRLTDIAMDATIRAAAPYQRDRGAGMAGRNAVIIESGDIREKIRVGKVSTATLFVVDASGSMGALNRMESAKGAVMSLLMDSYQQRDRIGMVAFKGDSADVLLPLCSSVDLAFERLRELPTGGKTPLGAGLNSGLNLLLGEKRKNDETIPIMVLISDGRANVSVNGGKPGAVKEELLAIAEEARSAGIHVIVLDAESMGSSFVKMQLGYCREIAEHAGGRYYSVDQLSSGQVHDIVAQEQGSLIDMYSAGRGLT